MSDSFMALLWYLIIGFSVVAYVALDGFDLGVGILNFFTKKDEDRRLFLNSIGPVWDGNEVWLVIVGGALFAGFPAVYASLFSGFYDLCMLLLAGLIFRAVAIEFRSKRPSPFWRKTWDATFSTASLVIAFVLGVIFGNLMDGLPLDAENNFSSSFSLFSRPFPLLIGVFTVGLMALHGSLFLSMKTEGELHERVRRWAKKGMVIFLSLFLVTTVAAWIITPHMVIRFKENFWLLSLPAATLVSIFYTFHFFKKGWDGWAFLLSCLNIAILFCIFGAGTFPYLVRSTVDTDLNSLTFYNAAASQLTLKVLLIIVAIGVPMVLAYGTLVYRVFRGKVRIDKNSY